MGTLDTAAIAGIEVALNCAQSSHYCMSLDRAKEIPVEHVYTPDGVTIEGRGYKALCKLHTQMKLVAL